MQDTSTGGPWRVERRGRNVHYVILDAGGSDWEQWFLLSGDRHIDSADSDREMQMRHLRQAKERGAGVIDVGDVFDAMQGRNDPRRMKGVGRADSIVVANYLDKIIEDASDALAPFASQFVVIGQGNHETAVLKNNETCLTTRLCERMSFLSGCKVHAGGYGGWVRFIAKWSAKGEAGLSLKYFHGSGGGGLMTHDTLRTRRIASWVPDADVILGGHTHDSWVMTLARERLGRIGQVYLDEQHHVRTPSYKDEYGDGAGGWHVERGAPPKPTGAWWMRIRWKIRRQRLGVDFIRAD
jgi:hypothetical protein